MAQIQWTENRGGTLLQMLAEALPAYYEAAQKKKRLQMEEDEFKSREQERKDRADRWKKENERADEKFAREEADRKDMETFFDPANRKTQANPFANLSEVPGYEGTAETGPAQGPMAPIDGPDYEGLGQKIYGRGVVAGRWKSPSEMGAAQQTFTGRNRIQEAADAKQHETENAAYRKAIDLQNLEHKNRMAEIGARKSADDSIQGKALYGEAARKYREDSLRRDQNERDARKRMEEAKKNLQRHVVAGQKILNPQQKAAHEEMGRNLVQELNDATDAYGEAAKAPRPTPPSVADYFGRGPLKASIGEQVKAKGDEPEKVHNPKEEKAEGGQDGISPKPGESATEFAQRALKAGLSKDEARKRFYQK